MSDTWMAELIIAVAEWAGFAALPLLGGYIAASSGAAHEVEFYGGER